MKKYFLKDVLAVLGINRKTLYLWELKKKITFHRTPKGYRYLTEAAFQKLRRHTQ